LRGDREGRSSPGSGRGGTAAWSGFYNLLPKVVPRTRRAPFTFVAFDVLAYDDEPVIGWSYERRRALLDRLELNGGAWCATPVLNDSVIDVLGACGEHDVEGIVAKRVDSPYQPGTRSDDLPQAEDGAWKSLHALRRHEH